MPAQPIDGEIEVALSSARLTPYLVATGEDLDAALRLYWWNIEASAAFYGPLHCLEVSLRNALHGRLALTYGRADWWSAAPLNLHGQRKIAEARAKAESKVRRRGGASPTTDDMVVELTFGFWVSLLSGARSYDRSFWVPTLHQAFPGFSRSRAELHDSLQAMVYFRNRIMHYEPIHHRDLVADRAKIYRLLGYVAPGLGRHATGLDRVLDVLARRAEVCGGAHPSRF